MAVGFQTPGNVLCKWGARGAPIARELAPQSDDYFVLKSRHSGFFQTPLDLLLQNLRAKKLILCGLTTDSCVLFTANDGYLRGLEIFVPADCCAALAKRQAYRCSGTDAQDVESEHDGIDFDRLLQ